MSHEQCSSSSTSDDEAICSAHSIKAINIKRGRLSESQCKSDSGEISVKKIKVDVTNEPCTSASSLKRTLSPDPFLNEPQKYSAQGLKPTLHGITYQLLLIIFFLQRGLRKEYCFRLASEMNVAEKLDDLVLQIASKNKTKVNPDDNNGGNPIFIYSLVQAKHKQDKKKRVSYNHLTTKNFSAEFSLPKYFHSYCKIKRSPPFNKGEIKDVILFTNIDIDLKDVTEPINNLVGFQNISSLKHYISDSKDLEENRIYLQEIQDLDDFLTFSSEYNGKHYKLVLPAEHELRHILKNISDVHLLASELFKHIKEEKPLHKTNTTFKKYHVALKEEGVLCILNDKKNYYAKFGKGFLTYNTNDPNDTRNDPSLSDAAITLRICLQNLLDEANLAIDKNTKLRVASGFGKRDESTNIFVFPNNECDIKDIDDFFEHLVLAVNQPSRVDLKKEIEEELNITFNLIDSELMVGRIIDEMLHWLETTGEKGEEGEFYSYKAGKNLLQTIKQNFSKWILIGSKLEYEVKTEEFGIKFTADDTTSELENFLIDEEKSLFFLTTENNILSGIKVYYALQSKEEYRQQDSYIFMKFRTLQRLLNVVKEAFASKHSKLLVIQSCGEKSSKFTAKSLFEILKIDESKKIILITKESDALYKAFKKALISASKCQVKHDNRINFDNLDETSQSKLETVGKFKLQGFKADLRGFIDKAALSMMDTETFAKFINNETIPIGNPLPDLGSIGVYYISRCFPRIEIDRSVVTDIVDKIIFDDNVEDFESCCNSFPQNNVHWLKDDQEKLTWRNTRGHISQIKKYRKDFTSSDVISENDFVEHIYNRIVVISDKAGTGKSTIITTLATHIKEKFPYIWVVRINLNEYTRLLEEKLEDKRFTAFDESSSVNFLIKMLNSQPESQIKSGFEMHLFKKSFDVLFKIVIFFDGFDEICPDYSDLVINLLFALKKSKVHKIFITTRPHLMPDLQDKLDTFSYHIRNFSEEDQIRFLLKYWAKMLGLNLDCIDETNAKRLLKYALQLMYKISLSIKDSEKNFTGIALQMRMIAEIFKESSEDDGWEGCSQYLSGSHELANLPATITLLNLYELYVEKKFYDHYNEKKKIDFSKTGTRTEKKYKLMKFIKIHEALANIFFWGNNDPFHLHHNIKDKVASFIEKIKSGECNLGLIYKIIDDKPHFIHRTFAEYFAASSIIRLLENKETNNNIRESLLTIILIKPNFEMVRLFLNSKLETAIIPDSNYTLHNWESLSQEYEKDPTRNTPLHRAALEGNLNILLQLLKNIEKSSINDVLQIRNKSSMTPLHCAAHKNHSAAVKMLVEYGADAEEDYFGETILLMAANKHFIDLIELLVKPISENGLAVNVNAIDRQYNTALHICSRLNVEIVRFLVDHGCDINAQNKSGQTPLLIAADTNNWEIVEWLIKPKKLDVGGADLTLADKEGNTILVIAASANKWEIVTQLLKLLQDQGHSNFDWVKLHEAAFEDNLPIVQSMCECIDKDAKGLSMLIANTKGQTVLHKAADSGSIMVTEWLVNYGAYVNAIDSDGNTPLHLAVRGDTMEIVELLSRPKDKDGGGADVNAENKEKESILQTAYGFCELDILQQLVERGAIVRPEDLNKAIFSCIDIKIANWLLKQNASVNFQDANGNTAIHLAAKSKEEIILKWLIAKGGGGADVNITNNHGDTVLHIAVLFTDLELLRWLVKPKEEDGGGVDVNIKNTFGRTALHEAVELSNMDKFKIVECLVKEGNADITIKDDKKETAFDLAEQGDYIEILDLLRH